MGREILLLRCRSPPVVFQRDAHMTPLTVTHAIRPVILVHLFRRASRQICHCGLTFQILTCTTLLWSDGVYLHGIYLQVRQPSTWRHFEARAVSR